MRAARAGSSAPSERRSEPSTNRIARYSVPSCSPAPNTGSTFGWSIEAASRDSAMNRSRKPGSAARSGATSFNATVRPSASSTAS